jgi:hypothetical protein
MNSTERTASGATERQLKVLRELGIQPKPTLSRYEAMQIIEENAAAWATLPPTRQQQWFLDQHRLWRTGMTRGQASELIEVIKRQQEHLDEQEGQLGRPIPADRQANGSPLSGSDNPTC